jgi:hypothetical protein
LDTIVWDTIENEGRILDLGWSQRKKLQQAYSEIKHYNANPSHFDELRGKVLEAINEIE